VEPARSRRRLFSPINRRTPLIHFHNFTYCNVGYLSFSQLVGRLFAFARLATSTSSLDPVPAIVMHAILYRDDDLLMSLTRPRVKKRYDECPSPSRMRCPQCDSSRIRRQAGMRPKTLHNIFFVVGPVHFLLLARFAHHSQSVRPLWSLCCLRAQQAGVPLVDSEEASQADPHKRLKQFRAFVAHASECPDQ